jgi:hypothetical protein
MLLSEEFLSRWEDLVEGVDKTDVPVDCIKRVVIKLKDGRRRYLNMSTLRKKGLDPIELEGVLNQKLEEYDKQIQNVDFFVDVDQVADLIQPETDKMLGGL